MEKYIITVGYTIKEVMEVFEYNRDRAVMVVNQENKVIGSVSQGDIIKALASGRSIYTKAENIMNNSFIFLNSADYKKAYEIFKNKKISLIPVLDNENKLINIITLDDIFKYLVFDENKLKE